MDYLMKPTPFDPEKHLAPIPFTLKHCRLAAELKEAGLSWVPHVGCFVWDPGEYIKANSPFPERIYFVLNLVHFLHIFQNIEKMVEKLVWLPTWHQTHLLCKKQGLDKREIAHIWDSEKVTVPGDELLILYEVLLKSMHMKKLA